MAMLTQQRAFKSRIPTKPLQNHNHKRTMYGITLCLLGPNHRHARTSMSSLKSNRNKRDRLNQVTLHNRRSVPRLSTREHPQIPQCHFLEKPRPPLESWGSILTSHLLYQRRKLPTNPTTLPNHHPRNQWIYLPSYLHFQQIWTTALV